MLVDASSVFDLCIFRGCFICFIQSWHLAKAITGKFSNILVMVTIQHAHNGTASLSVIYSGSLEIIPTQTVVKSTIQILSSLVALVCKPSLQYYHGAIKTFQTFVV